MSLASGIAVALAGDSGGRGAWEVIGLAVASGVVTFLLLWLGSFIVYLVRAPRALRLRRMRQLEERQISLLGFVRGPRRTVLAHDALALRQRLWEFDQLKKRLRGRGPANEATLSEKHREAHKAIERFAEQVMGARSEETSRRERREAMRLYELLRGFPLTAEVGPLLDLISDFTRPRSPWRYKLRIWVRGKWHQVS